MEQNRPTLDYATPPTLPPKRGTSPYVVFAICTCIATLGVTLLFDGGRDERDIAPFLAMPGILGAIVLPILIQLRRTR